MRTITDLNTRNGWSVLFNLISQFWSQNIYNDMQSLKLPKFQVGMQEIADLKAIILSLGRQILSTISKWKFNLLAANTRIYKLQLIAINADSKQNN